MKDNTRISLVLSVALGLIAGQGIACNKRKTGAKPEAVIYQTGPTTWTVCVPGWQTVAIAKDAYCAVGLSVPANGQIVSVDGAAMFDDRNSATIVELAYASSSAVGTEFNAKQAGNWTGFLAQASAAIAADLPNLYCFSVTTKPGTTAAQMAAALLSSFAGSDDADAQGKLGGGTNQVIFQFTTVTNDTCSRNLKLFHNAESSNVSTRVTTDKADTIYFMQPREFRYGQGEATGWRGGLQDLDPSTAETVELGYVSYADSTSILPNVTAAGSLTSVRYSLFGFGGASAVKWTLTTATKIPLPSFSGVRIVLPAPSSWPQDGVTIHTQDGTYSKLPAAQRLQWTYNLQGSAAAAFRPAGSTHHLGGLYDCPTQSVFAFSSAYGPTRALFGPESLHPQGGLDLVGFEVRSERFKAGTFALVIISAGYQPRPIPTPFKALLITLPEVTTAVIAMDANGVGRSIGFPLGPETNLSAQSAMLEFTQLQLLFTDASLVRTRK